MAKNVPTSSAIWQTPREFDSQFVSLVGVRRLSCEPVRIQERSNPAMHIVFEIQQIPKYVNVAGLPRLFDC